MDNKKQKTRIIKLPLDPKACLDVFCNKDLRRLIEEFQTFEKNSCELSIHLSKQLSYNWSGLKRVMRYIVTFKLGDIVPPNVVTFLERRFQTLNENDDFEDKCEEMLQFQSKFQSNRITDTEPFMQFTIEYEMSKNRFTLQELHQSQEKTDTLLAKHIALLCKELFPSSKEDYAYDSIELVKVVQQKIVARKQGGFSSDQPLDLSTTTTIERVPKADVKPWLQFKLVKDDVLLPTPWLLPREELFPPSLGNLLIDSSQARNVKKVVRPQPALVLGNTDSQTDPTYSITVRARNMVNLVVEDINNNFPLDYNENNDYTAFSFFQRFTPLPKLYEFKKKIKLRWNCPTIFKYSKNEAFGLNL